MDGVLFLLICFFLFISLTLGDKCSKGSNLVQHFVGDFTIPPKKCKFDIVITDTADTLKKRNNTDFFTTEQIPDSYSKIVCNSLNGARLRR